MFNFADTGGLFDHFEVNREPFWRKISWLVAGSGAWHLVIVALILLIPPVRDAFSITAMFRDAGFVDKPYAHTEIEDADIIDFSGEKFHYPEGYFAMDQEGIPPLPQFPVTPQFAPARLSRAPSPSPNPSDTPTPTPSATPLIASNPKGKGKPGEVKPPPSPGPEDKTAQDKAEEEKVQAAREKAAKQAGIEMPAEGEINKRPFQDLGNEAKDLSDKGKLDLNQQFEVTIETKLDAQGKLVGPQITKQTGDDQLIKLSRRFVETLNDSGVLFYLKALNQNNPNSNVSFTIKQDSTSVTAVIKADAKDPKSANILIHGFRAAIAYGVTQRKGKVEEQLLNNLTTTQEDNKIVFNFSMPRDEVVELVKKQLAEVSPTPPAK